MASYVVYPGEGPGALEEKVSPWLLCAVLYRHVTSGWFTGLFKSLVPLPVIFLVILSTVHYFIQYWGIEVSNGYCELSISPFSYVSFTSCILGSPSETLGPRLGVGRGSPVVLAALPKSRVSILQSRCGIIYSLTSLR